jgi:uncharacterized protein YdbL (DUF1318 family)
MAYSKKSVRKQFRFTEEDEKRLQSLAAHRLEVIKEIYEMNNMSADNVEEITESQMVRRLIRESYQKLKEEGYKLLHDV